MACYEGGQTLGSASPRNGTADVFHPLTNADLARSEPMLHLLRGDQLAIVAELLRTLVYRHIEFVVLGGVELLQGGESFTSLLLQLCHLPRRIASSTTSSQKNVSPSTTKTGRP
jgi:hypothetical protein